MICCEDSQAWSCSSPNLIPNLNKRSWQHLKNISFLSRNILEASHGCQDTASIPTVTWKPSWAVPLRGGQIQGEICDAEFQELLPTWAEMVSHRSRGWLLSVTGLPYPSSKYPVRNFNIWCIDKGRNVLLKMETTCCNMNQSMALDFLHNADVPYLWNKHSPEKALPRHLLLTWYYTYYFFFQA